MPSKTPKQAKFMRAVAHGWTPSRMKSPPSRAVAREFVEADKKYSGGFAENRYARGGLAFMNEVDSNSERARPLRGFQLGGGARGIAGMYRRARELAEGSQDPDVSPYGTEAGTTQQMLDRMGYSGPMGYLRLTSGLRQAGWTPASGSGDGDLANTMWYPPEGTLTGEDAPPPRIIPTDPASYVGGTASGTSGGGGGGGGGSGEGSEYREGLRQHRGRIEEILGSARGGHVNYYQEGGAARPGHAEGPNPHNKAKTPGMWATWERKYHKDPPPPPEPEPEPEEVPWYMKLVGYGSEESAGKVDEALAEMEQAYGGRVRYQAGGLAIAAPAGGVPPWIAPTGSGPGYMDEPPPGYQFGGIANRFNPPPAAAPPAAGPAPVMAQAESAFNAQTGGPRGGVMGGQYRGVPPQRGMISRGAGGDPAAMAERMRGMAGAQRGMARPAVMPPGFGGDRMGALQQAFSAARSGMGGPGGGSMGRLPPGFRDPMSGGRGGQYGYEGDPSQPGYDDRSYEDFVAQQRQQGNVSGLPGITDEVLRSRYEGRNANQGAIFTSGPGAPGGGGGRFGNYDPRIRTGPSPNIGRPGWDQIGDMGPITGPGRRPGKPRPGPGMMPPGEEGGGIPGGPRVPPNMRGYLQKQRMMNRPPANVGGGANRVGMADQQGALSRAMQRGTGRPPMSRRAGFGRAGRRR